MPKKLLTLNAINERLAETGIRLYQRGSKLYLRATLPNKNGQPGEKQQWISLGFGLTPLELEQAEAKGWELSGGDKRPQTEINQGFKDSDQAKNLAAY